MTSLVNHEEAAVVRNFRDICNEVPDGEPNDSLSVIAIKALLRLLEHSTASTMMGLQEELELATTKLLDFFDSSDSQYTVASSKTALSLRSGCELFVRHVTRTVDDFPGDFQACKEALLRRGGAFAQLTERSRLTISRLGHPFIRHGSVVLTHGRSRVVEAVLMAAVQQGKHFHVIVTECSSIANEAQDQARFYSGAGLPVTVVTDAAVATIMQRVDMVIVGAEAVVESGGVVNRTGTYQIGIVCAALKKPLYVAAESYKFARLYPLDQRDLPKTVTRNSSCVLEHLKLPDGVGALVPKCDYTPANYITLLFTDLGVLTPAAVSDELIKLYQ